ncbi:MAG: putative quinol monooxygenase [Pseudomonadota bacterium]
MADKIHLPEPDADERGPYALIGSCRAKPGSADALEALILGLVKPIRSEAGAIEFHVHRDRADRDVFVIYEIYRSLAELKLHISLPYTQSFIENVKPLVDGGLKQQFLRMSSALPAPSTAG